MMATDWTEVFRRTKARIGLGLDGKAQIVRVACRAADRVLASPEFLQLPAPTDDDVVGRVLDRLDYSRTFGPFLRVQVGQPFELWARLNRRIVRVAVLETLRVRRGVRAPLARSCRAPKVTPL
jgi:hypothetical protein